MAENTIEKTVVAGAEEKQTPEEMAKYLTLDILEREYGRLQKEADKLDETKNLLKEAAIIMFEKEYGHQGATYTNPYTGNKLQRILQVTQKIDQDKIKKVLTSAQYGKVSAVAVQLDKLMAAIKVGDINPAALQDSVSMKEIDKLSWKAAK